LGGLATRVVARVVGVYEAPSRLFFGSFFEFVRLFLFYFNSASPLGFLTFAKILDERLGIFSPFSGEFFFDP
jgi:hypothetical protein